MRDAVNFSEEIINESLLGGTIIFGVWILKVVSALLGIVLLTGLGYLMKNRLGPANKLVSSSFMRLLGIGVAVAFLLARRTMEGFMMNREGELITLRR